MEVGEVRDPQAVELVRQSRQLDFELAQPWPCRLGEAVDETGARKCAELLQSSARDGDALTRRDGRVRDKDAGSGRSRRLRPRLRTLYRAGQRGEAARPASLVELSNL